MLAGKVGNVSYLLKKFNDGLSYWKSFAAPSPESIGMNEKELSMVLKFNQQEFKLHKQTLDGTKVDSSYTGFCISHVLDIDIQNHVTPCNPRDCLDDQPRAPKKPPTCRSCLVNDALEPKNSSFKCAAPKTNHVTIHLNAPHVPRLYN